MSRVTLRPSAGSQSISGSSWTKVNSPKSPFPAIHFARVPSGNTNSAGAIARRPAVADARVLTGAAIRAWRCVSRNAFLRARRCAISSPQLTSFSNSSPVIRRTGRPDCTSVLSIAVLVNPEKLITRPTTAGGVAFKRVKRESTSPMSTLSLCHLVSIRYASLPRVASRSVWRGLAVPGFSTTRKCLRRKRSAMNSSKSYPRLRASSASFRRWSSRASGS